MANIASNSATLAGLAGIGRIRHRPCECSIPAGLDSGLSAGGQSATHPATWARRSRIAIDLGLLARVPPESL